MAPKRQTVESLIVKYTGKRFGSWTVGKGFHKVNKNWCVDVLCDCGKTQIVTVSAFPTHNGCSCAYLERVQNYKNMVHEQTDLEKIWPSVIKAGRKVMEKYNAMASI